AATPRTITYSRAIRSSATGPPVTEPPETEPPVEVPPVTEPPVTGPPVLESPVTGVAGAASLVHLHQPRVPVAVERGRYHALHMARGLTLDPVLLPAAGPVGAPPGGQRAVQRFVVHPAQHQHLAGVVLLGDGRDEPGRVALEPRGYLGVEPRGPP